MAMASFLPIPPATNPPRPAGKVTDRQVQAKLNGIESSQPESELAALVAPIQVSTVNETLRAALARAQAFDEALKPFNRILDQIESLVSRAAAPPNRDFTVARLRYTGLRYDAESRLN
jgi:hypothetical protein